LELALQRVAFGAQAVPVVLEGVEPPLAVGALDGLEDFGSVALEGLAGGAGKGGLPGDGPVGAIEDGRGVGDAESRR